MLAALPLVALGALIVAWAQTSASWREAIVAGSISWGVVLVGLTEILSVPRALNSSSLTVFWALTAGISALMVVRTHRSSPLPPIGPLGLSLGERFLVAVIVVVLSLTLLQGLIAATSFWDSLSYHMPRVAHWAQNHSVRHYPTHIQRQLWLNPGAEFVVLNLQLLSGGDRLANLPQWFAFAGSISIASLIAKKIGVSRRGQLFSAFFVATLPGAIVQATGTQAEIVHAFWLCCLASVGLAIINEGRNDVTLCQRLLFGSALGLALLTKATAFLFAAPFCIWFFVGKRQLSIRKRFAVAAVVLLVAASLNVGHVTRNYLVYGSAVPDLPESQGTVNQAITPAGFASNAVRNIAMHFWTRWKVVNTTLYDGVEAIHSALGISVNEGAYTWGKARFTARRDQYDELFAGSPLQLLLIAAAAFAVLLRLRSTESQARHLLASLLSGAILFSLVFRWQPWHTRLHLPLLILAAPLVGYWIEKTRRNAAFHAPVAILALNAVPFLLLNHARPLVRESAIYRIPRHDRYFMESPWLQPFYQDLTSYVAGAHCPRIGIWVRWNYLEYPLWALLAEKSPVMPEIRHIQVKNSTSVLAENGPFRPCLIIRMGDVNQRNTFVVPGGYALAWVRDSAAIFRDSTLKSVPELLIESHGENEHGRYLDAASSLGRAVAGPLQVLGLNPATGPNQLKRSTSCKRWRPYWYRWTSNTTAP